MTMITQPNSVDEAIEQFHKQTKLIKLESSGGMVNYYLSKVEYPQRKDQVPYVAECEDLIDSLQLTPDEANVFKEIWRTANQRLGSGKEGNTPLRAAQKMVHYSNRILTKAKRSTK